MVMSVFCWVRTELFRWASTRSLMFRETGFWAVMTASTSVKTPFATVTATLTDPRGYGTGGPVYVPSAAAAALTASPAPIAAISCPRLPWPLRPGPSGRSMKAVDIRPPPRPVSSAPAVVAAASLAWAPICQPMIRTQAVAVTAETTARDRMGHPSGTGWSGAKRRARHLGEERYTESWTTRRRRWCLAAEAGRSRMSNVVREGGRQCHRSCGREVCDGRTPSGFCAPVGQTSETRLIEGRLQRFQVGL